MEVLLIGNAKRPEVAFYRSLLGFIKPLCDRNRTMVKFWMKIGQFPFLLFAFHISTTPDKRFKTLHDAKSSGSVYWRKLHLGDRVLGEVEKKNFIALPGKGRHSRFVPLKILCPNLTGFEEEFYSNGSRVYLLIRLEWIQGLYSLIWS